jgi:DNA-binding PadR family transcriptional regulator
MPSTLGYALLALLARSPQTGYELAASLRRPVAYFWEAQYSQVHPELQRLLAGGLVDFEPAPGPGPRDKKIYSLTEQGRQALREWLPQPPRPQPARNELVLKAYGIWAADRAAARRLFEQQATAHEARLAEYETQWAAVESRHHQGPPPPDHPDFGNYAALWYGLSFERHRIAWCRWMVSQLDPPPAATSPPPSSQTGTPPPKPDPQTHR